MPENVTDGLLKHHHRVEQRANQLAVDMVEVLEKSRSSILGKLALIEDKILKGEFLDEPAARRRKVLQAQREEISRLLRGLYGDMEFPLLEAAQDTMDGTAEVTTRLLNDSFGLSVSVAKLDEKIVRAWFETSTVDGLLVNEWMRKLESTARDRIIAAGRQSMVEGLGTRSAARLMRRQGVQGSVPGLEGLARTWLQSASHYAKEQTVTENFTEVVKGWRYTATLDDRTCLICGPDDGKEYGLEDPKPILPRHWRCRCAYVPISKSWKELGADIGEKPEGTRPAVKHSGRTVNHRDGSTSTAFSVEAVEQLPAGTTYNQWMKAQLEKDPDFVRSVLGETRFKLFESGKASLKSMSAHGRIKRVSEVSG